MWKINPHKLILISGLYVLLLISVDFMCGLTIYQINWWKMMQIFLANPVVAMWAKEREH